jgi:hypothetical protein
VAFTGVPACDEEQPPQADFGPISVYVWPESGAPYTDGTLSGEVDVQHPVEEFPTFTWSWMLDGADAGITDRVLPAGTHVKGDLWEVTVEADFGNGNFVGPVSAEILVLNKPPDITKRPLPRIKPNRPTVDDTLTIPIEVTDADGDDITLSYSWRKDGGEIATTPTLNPSFFTEGDVITVFVTASDGEDDSVPALSRPATILPADD